MCHCRGPYGPIPNQQPRALDGAPVLHCLIVAAWVCLGALGVAGWICLIWFGWFLLSV